MVKNFNKTILKRFIRAAYFNLLYKLSFLIYSFCVNGKQIIKQLEASGWEVLRISGSHHRLGKGNLRTTVPVHGQRDIGKGLVAAIERQTGVKLV